MLADVDYPRYINYINRIEGIQHLYRWKIAVRLSMEFGIQTHTISQFETLFWRYPFDFKRTVTT